MRDERASRIRTPPRSGDLPDMGGRSETGLASEASVVRDPSTARLLAAFAAVYLIWGST